MLKYFELRPAVQKLMSFKGVFFSIFNSSGNCFWQIKPVLVSFCREPYENIRIHHEREGGIEKSAPRITDWHLL